MHTNASGQLDQYAQKLEEGASDEELGAIARKGAVTFRALSLACQLAAAGGDELVEADQFRMDRRQAFNMGQASAQRHNVGLFHAQSLAFMKLARHHGATIGDVESDAERFMEQVVSANRNRTAW